ncbi:MAG: hypothetical protein ACKVP3_26485 [Hyphomicrobiaceae bacterium]
MPFLYYLVFLGVLATGFVANAFLHGGDAPTVAAVGRVTTDTTPLEKLQREISIRRGVIPPQQEEHIDVKVSPIVPITVQMETATVVPERTLTGETRAADANSDNAQPVVAQPEQAAPVKRTRHKEADKCGPGGCGAKQARSTWSGGDTSP